MMVMVRKPRKADFPLACVIVAAALLGCTGEARCQTSPTTPRLTMQGPAEQSNSTIIRDALNRPCLDVEAAARAHIVNPEMVDHVVSVKNNCARLIKVKVCYFNAYKCNEFSLQGYSRVDTVLGTMAGVKTFRYSLFQR